MTETYLSSGYVGFQPENQKITHFLVFQYGTPLPMQSIVSLVLWFLCLLYASIRSSNQSSFDRLARTDSSQTGPEEIDMSENASGRRLFGGGGEGETARLIAGSECAVSLVLLVWIELEIWG